MVRTLRAVAAILGATSCLDREQLRALHPLRVMVLTVDGRRLEDELKQGTCQEVLDMLEGDGGD